MREIGFWCSGQEDPSGNTSDATRLNPLALVDDVWFAESDPDLLQKIGWYLTRAFVESHEFAYSFCRFSTCSLALEQPRVMGACTMTDGVYCWPEGYWHYIDHHHVKPPQEFLDHVLNSYDTLVEMTRKSRNEKKLLLWDCTEHEAVNMPQGMLEWITSYTTVQVDL
ncbi:unnamed protein product [Hyaloperonospora brassicae]|uniref:Uncharacterized protein n=1 Tax=Hyaloperonospora brassicae TaxID=162125 RepID=A0AAV0V690_HYABA|nr:unnamed protein product [Hyaloperonospora brassicae]